MNLDLGRTALVAVDLMPRIIAADLAPHSGPSVLARTLRLASALRSAGGTIVWVRAERPGVATQPPGSELALGCDPQPSDLLIVKNSWGAFATTGLDQSLRDRGIDTLIITGIATTMGVESTARAADDLGYRTCYPEDAMTGMDAHAHAFTIDYVFPRLGEVTTTADLLASITGSS